VTLIVRGLSKKAQINRPTTGPRTAQAAQVLEKGHSTRRTSVCPKDEARPTADHTGERYMGLNAFTYKQCPRRLRGNR
jgi:hypothetical protein